MAVTGAWVDTARTASPLLLLLGPPACRPRSTVEAIALRILLPAVAPRGSPWRPGQWWSERRAAVGAGRGAGSGSEEGAALLRADPAARTRGLAPAADASQLAAVAFCAAHRPTDAFPRPSHIHATTHNCAQTLHTAQQRRPQLWLTSHRATRTHPGVSMESGALGVLKKRVAAIESARLTRLQAAAARTAALLAAIHYSRSLALRCGWAPWRALMHRMQQQSAAADALRRRSLAAGALAAFQRCRHVAAWRSVAAEACATAAAWQLHQQTLQRHALAALRNHTQWVQTAVPAMHAARLQAAAWCSWRQLAATAAQQLRLQTAHAAAHFHRNVLRGMLCAWQRGAAACKTERLVEQRRQQRWATVERYLAEHRAAKGASMAVTGAAAQPAGQRLGGAWSSSGSSGAGVLLGSGCGPDATPPSSAENSAWDPNTLFSGAPNLDF